MDMATGARGGASREPVIAPLNIASRKPLQPNAPKGRDKIAPHDFSVALVGLGRAFSPGGREPKPKPIADCHSRWVNMLASVNRPEQPHQFLFCFAPRPSNRRGPKSPLAADRIATKGIANSVGPRRAGFDCASGAHCLSA